MRELALHLLDIAENSVAAQARNINIQVFENTLQDRLKISIDDDGKGMDSDLLEQVTDPFVTSRITRKVGLGIPLLKAAAEACNGFLDIQSQVGAGTHLSVEFQRSHIDRMPLGDLPGTFLHLLIGNPGIHWVFQYQMDDQEFLFDDNLIKRELEGILLTEPTILSYLRHTLTEGIEEIQPTEANLEIDKKYMSLAEWDITEKEKVA